jgi:hypothetical protein
MARNIEREMRGMMINFLLEHLGSIVEIADKRAFVKAGAKIFSPLPRMITDEALRRMNPV